MNTLKQLRSGFERFCYKHRSWGIPNLMLYICLGSVIVYFMSLFNGGDALYSLLCFDKAKILQGQVWRLFTYVFTYASGNVLLVLISLLCYCSLGRAMENVWGTFRFNLFYLSGVLLMDIFAMIFSPITYEFYTVDGSLVAFPASYYSNMVYYLNLSLLIGFATLYPDSHFMLMMLIPVKAWIFGLLYLILVFVDVFNMTFPTAYFPHNLFPLIGVANYLLFFGKDCLNLIPLSWRAGTNRRSGKKQKKTGTVPFSSSNSHQASAQKPKVSYLHRCTVCGRTDVSHPDLEFRYCSRCNGYFCYCQDHINNHTHVE